MSNQKNNEKKEFKVIGTIKSINILENSIKINFQNVIDNDVEMVVFEESKPQLKSHCDKWNICCEGIDQQLMYNLFRDRQLLRFGIEEFKANGKMKEDSYSHKLKSLETIYE